MKDVDVYNGGIGLNNKVVAHRLPFDLEEGVCALEVADNIMNDKTGEIVTRRGSDRVLEGSFRSMFRITDSFLVVKDRETDSALYKAVPDLDGGLSLYGIRDGLSLRQNMSFVELEGEYLYSNGFENGIIKQGQSYPWPTNSFGVETNAEMVPLPVGKHLGILSGRVLTVVGQELFFTEYGLTGLMDSARNRVRFESDIIMNCPVETGTYVSDKKSIYFLAGTNPHEWKSKRVSSDYPAVEWGVHPQLVDPSLFGFETSDPSALFATVNGPVIGLPDGTIKNLIQENVFMPKDCGIQVGAIMVVDETVIIQSGM